jgi:molybdopterin-guanine dinucleotide biosynthesis protein B
VATDTPLPALSVPVLDLNDTEAVAQFILSQSGLTRTPPFDTVAVVDWSAAAAPSPKRPSKDAIWIGVAKAEGVTTTYHRTRHAAETFLTGLLDSEAAAGRRVLLGFDFPMGYPQGFAAHLTGQPRAQAVWGWLARHITDLPSNANNRFAVADQINAQFRAPGPFWGRPDSAAHPHLPPTKAVSYATLGIPERRRVEALVASAQPVWKLYTTGSVGSQALMGLPLIHRLSQRPGASVWPFESPTTPLVLAEVYPSLLSTAVNADRAPIKDEAQVRLLARALFALSQTDALEPLFVTPSQAIEEGWILGVGHQAALFGALS